MNYKSIGWLMICLAILLDFFALVMIKEFVFAFPVSMIGLVIGGYGMLLTESQLAKGDKQ